MRSLCIPPEQHEKERKSSGTCVRRNRRDADKRDGNSRSGGPRIGQLPELLSNLPKRAEERLRRPAPKFEPPFECEFCGKVYAKIVYLRTHLRKKHAIPKVPPAGLRAPTPKEFVVCAQTNGEECRVENHGFAHNGLVTPSYFGSSITGPLDQCIDDDSFEPRAFETRDPFFGSTFAAVSSPNNSCSRDLILSLENVDLDNDQFFNVDDTPRFLKMVLGIEDPLASFEDRVPTELEYDDADCRPKEMELPEQEFKIETETVSERSNCEDSEAGSARKEPRRIHARKPRAGLPTLKRRRRVRKWKVVRRQEIGLRIKMFFRREFVDTPSSQ